MTSRRQFLGLMVVAGVAARAEAARARAPLRFGLTPVMLDDHTAFLQVWRGYLEKRLQREVEFVQRGNYREINDLLRQHKLDVAWICGYPYVRYRREMRLLAVPLFRGKPLYQSYLIVPANDSDTGSILDLEDKVFAYSDPDSNSGYLYPRYALFAANRDPDNFFRKTFFTHAHRKVVEAVAVGLASGGSVDGYVWETLRLYHPSLTARTRVVAKSPEFGHTPVVTRTSIAARDFAAVQDVLLGMAGNKEGAALLTRLNLDGFIAGSEQLFDGIAEMVTRMRRTAS